VLKETYRWILAPTQDPKKKGGLTEVYWEEKPIAAGFNRRMGEAIQGVLIENEIVINKWSPIHLKDILLAWFWKDDQRDIRSRTYGRTSVGTFTSPAPRRECPD